MNERFKVLAEQATSYKQIDGENGFFPLEVFDKEKFAELIVKACAGAADMVPAHCKYPGDYVVEQMGFGLVEGVSTFRS